MPPTPKPSANVIVFGIVLIVLVPGVLVAVLTALGRDPAVLLTVFGATVPTAVLAFLALLKVDNVQSRANIIQEGQESQNGAIREAVTRVNDLETVVHNRREGDPK